MLFAFVTLWMWWGGGSAGPSLAWTTQRAEQSYWQHTLRFKGSPPIHQLHQSPAAWLSRPIGGNSNNNNNNPPPSQKKNNILTDGLSGAQELQKQSPPHHRECVHRGEGVWGGGREGMRQTEGREEGRRESKLWETSLHLSHSTGAEQGAGQCLTTRSTPITALIMMGMIILPVVLMKRKNSPDQHTGKMKFFQIPSFLGRFLSSGMVGL